MFFGEFRGLCDRRDDDEEEKRQQQSEGGGGGGGEKGLAKSLGNGRRRRRVKTGTQQSKRGKKRIKREFFGRGIRQFHYCFS